MADFMSTGIQGVCIKRKQDKMNDSKLKIPVTFTPVILEDKFKCVHPYLCDRRRGRTGECPIHGGALHKQGSLKATLLVFFLSF